MKHQRRRITKKERRLDKITLMQQGNASPVRKTYVSSNVALTKDNEVNFIPWAERFKETTSKFLKKEELKKVSKEETPDYEDHITPTLAVFPVAAVPNVIHALRLTEKEDCEIPGIITSTMIDHATAHLAQPDNGNTMIKRILIRPLKQFWKFMDSTKVQNIGESILL